MKKKRKLTEEEKAQMEYLDSFLNKSKEKSDSPKKDTDKKINFWSKENMSRLGF
jgi:hypothetical protein